MKRNAVLFQPENTGYDKKAIKDNQKLVLSIKGDPLKHHSVVNATCFNPLTKTLFTGSDDATIKAWSVSAV